MTDTAMHNSSKHSIDASTAVVLAGFGAPVPVNAMPDSYAINAAMSSEPEMSHLNTQSAAPVLLVRMIL